MGKYAVDLKPSRRKELERLPAKLIERIFPKLEALGSEPRPVGCKKLKGGQQEWRIRVGDYRVVYTVDDVKLRVERDAHQASGKDFDGNVAGRRISAPEVILRHRC